jgi:hypothetical protein
LLERYNSSFGTTSSFVHNVRPQRNMKALRLLQLGDIHYPDSRLEEGSIDLKDSAFPTSLRNLTQLKPLQAIMRRLGQLKFDCILLCGDITTRGDVQQYDACLSYLFENLSLSNRDANQIHVVPGNHDVDRSKVDKNGHDLYEKFSSFSQLWEKRDLPILTVKGPRITSLESDSIAHATVISLNSSLGCGEHYYPEGIRSEMESMLSRYAVRVDPKEAFAIAGQDLDTPAIDIHDIDSVCDAVQNLNPKIVPVVLAHHNLLPQALPRIAIYTELINGGLIRSRLCFLGKTLLYCHGHIHQHPIEIIQDPRNERSKLVCIAAPELARGFNLLTLEFSSKGVPLGCVVECFSLNATDASVPSESFRVPLQDPLSRGKHAHPKLSNVLALIPIGGTRFAPLAQSIKKAEIRLNNQKLEELLVEAEWLGFLSIDDRRQDRDYWQIRSYGL